MTQFIPTRKEKVSHIDYVNWRIYFFSFAAMSDDRFGQAFVNRFYPDAGEALADVFYSTKNPVILEKEIYDRFIKFD